MANRNFEFLQTLGKQRKVLCGAFQPNGASTGVTSVKGNGFTVAHAAGANTYTVTLTDAYTDYDCVLVGYQGTALFDAQLIAEPDVKVAKTLVIGVFNSTTGAAVNDMAAAAATRVHFVIVLKNTSGNF